MAAVPPVAISVFPSLILESVRSPEATPETEESWNTIWSTVTSPGVVLVRLKRKKSRLSWLVEPSSWSVSWPEICCPRVSPVGGV